MADNLSRTVLYNEHLAPPANTTEVPDTPDGYLSGETLIAQDVGWAWAPLPAEPEPGTVAEPVTYAPVVTEPEPEATTKTKAPSAKPKEGDS